MRVSRFVVIALAVLMVVGSSADAFAKMGKGSSFGSRASRTADRPIERTVTPPPASAPLAPPVVAPAPSYAPSPAYGQSPGFFQRNPFMSGFMGGLVGVGIGSMLFGHSAYAMDASPGGGILGLLVQLALVGGLIWLLVRMFRGSGSVGGLSGGNRVLQAIPAGAPRTVARIAKEFEPSDADKQVFAQIMQESQRAWTNGDIGMLKQIATPEVVSYLADDMAADSSQGVRNVIEDVQLLRGEVVEAWTEGNRQFVTAAMTFAARDYKVRLDNGQVVEGNPNQPVQSNEAWTFVRVGGGRWLLSAVER